MSRVTAEAENTANPADDTAADAEEKVAAAIEEQPCGAGPFTVDLEGLTFSFNLSKLKISADV